jgi:hypothetical protein
MKNLKSQRAAETQHIQRLADAAEPPAKPVDDLHLSAFELVMLLGVCTLGSLVAALVMAGLQ